MRCLHSSPNPGTQSEGRRLGCAPMYSWLQHRVVHASQYSGPRRICYFCCRYRSLLSSYTTSLPKENSSFENNLLNAHSSPNLHKPTMTMHLQKTSDGATQRPYRYVLSQSVSWRTETNWSPCNGHRDLVFCWKLQAPDPCRAQRPRDQPGSIP